LKRKRELRSNSRYEWARPNHCSIWVDGGRRDDKHIAKVDTKIGPAAKAAIPVLEALQGESVIGSYARDALKKIRGY